MPATNQKSAPPTPASPRNTAKYTNKDGSKYITVPKAHSDSSQPPTPTMATKPSSPHPNPSANLDMSGPLVNRKKQKRRQKALAKAAAAERVEDGHANPASASASNLPSETRRDGREAAFSEGDGEGEDEGEGQREADKTPNAGSSSSLTNRHPSPSLGAKTKKNKRKKKKHAGGFGYADEESSAHFSGACVQAANHAGSRPSGMSRDKIWSTSNHEERERIKQFWLGLGEDERKSLVKVEKDAVLKKMKEQQKHTCSCTVCGRKRTAIEEELEGLYDAYYLELEQFANQGEGPPMLPPPPSRDFPPQPPRRLPSRYAPQQPSRGRIVEHVGDEDEDDDCLDEVYSEDEVDDDEYSDDEPPEQFHNPYDRDMTDFLTFGNSLQVKGTQLLDSLLSAYGNMDLGGILTVADDLLKNDGKRFIEMMEQLAERRMAREEDAREHFSRGYGHPNGSYSNPHNHPPPEEDELEDEEEDEEDYEDSQDEEYEEEEVYSNPSTMPSKFHTECCCQDQMTEEQRMEEGRRMFQIFAARMFEQRVLSAYKEKVAKERQDKLLEELEEESRQVDQQKAKKAKTAQKKKDKAAQKKQALAEEKARREADKAAEEAARLEAEQKRIAEQKQRAEDKRRQKEAQKKAEEEARLRKEAERLRRIHEQREKQAEQERRAREARERDKKLKDEQRQREKEAREQREREAQERREKQERDKREKEARAAKSLREAQEAAAQKAREARANNNNKDNTNSSSSSSSSSSSKPSAGQASGGQASGGQASGSHSQPIQIPKRGQAPAVPALPAALAQHGSSNPASYASPKMPVATPVLPKAPTPIRARAPSQQQDHRPGSSAASQAASMAASQNASPHPGTPIQGVGSPGGPLLGHDGKAAAGGGGAAAAAAVGGSVLSAQLHQLNLLNQQTPVAAHSSILASKVSGHTPPFQMPPASSLQPPPGLAPHRPPGFSSPMTPEPMFAPLAFRPGPANMMINNSNSTNNSNSGNMMMMQPPPGINGPAARGFPPGPMPPPGFAHSPADAFAMKQPFQQIPKDSSMPAHARQGSAGGFDSPVGQLSSLSSLPSLPSLPIGRPAPIGRPGSLSQGQSRDEDEDTKHLGSRVLVDDDEPLPTDMNPGSLRNQPPGPRGGFTASPFLDTGFNAMGQNPWGPPSAATQHYAPPPPPPPPPGFANAAAWGASPSMPKMASISSMPSMPSMPSLPPGFGLGSPIPAAALGPISMRTASQPRHVAVRSMLCQACKDLAGSGHSDANGYIDLGAVKAHIEGQSGDTSITEQDLLNLCDTEGNSFNGGGTFDIKHSRGSVPSMALIRWAPDPSDGSSSSAQGYRAVGAPGEMRSPLAGHASASLRGF
ncbi:hypothetical protein E4U41_004385 [Claviceps citrina]|nr:hypothetical protein E4U41_004385 [Claviceps citrina]